MALGWILLVSVAEANPEVLRFASGLRVIVEQRPGTARVAVATSVAAGQDDAPEGGAHVAHLTEHLWYRARTDGVPHGLRLHAWGCEWNAYTDLTETTFHASCPDDTTEVLLDLEAARLHGPLDGLDDAEVAIERDVLRIEVDGHRERDATVFQAVVSRLDPAAPEGARRDDDEAAYAPEAIRSWAAARYVPAATVIAIVSPRSPESLRPLLQARFGPVVSKAPVGPAARPAPAPLRPTLRLDVRRVPSPVAAPLVLVSFDLPPETMAIDTLLAGLLEWALARQLVGDGRATGVDCMTLLSSRRRALVCGIAPADHLGDAALDAFAAELRVRVDVRAALKGKLLRLGVDSALAELEASFRQVRDELGPSRSGWPALLSGWMLALDQLPPAEPELRAIRGPALRELQAQLGAALDPQRALVLLLMPDGTQATLPSPRPRAGEVTLPWPTIPAVGALAAPAVAVRESPRAVFVQRSDLHERHVQLVLGPDAHLGTVVVGPDAPEALGRDLPPPPSLPAAPPPPDEPVRFVAREPDGPPVALVQWRCAVRPEDDAAAVVAAELLGARLFWTLRADRAWSYTPEWAVAGDQLALGADVVEGAVPDALATIRDQVRGVAAGQISDGELAVAVRRGTVRTSLPLATARDWAGLAVGPAGWRDVQAMVGLAGRVAAVDSEAVAAAVGRCDPEAGWEVTGSPSVGAALDPGAAAP